MSKDQNTNTKIFLEPPESSDFRDISTAAKAVSVLLICIALCTLFFADNFIVKLVSGIMILSFLAIFFVFYYFGKSSRTIIAIENDRLIIKKDKKSDVYRLKSIFRFKLVKTYIYPWPKYDLFIIDYEGNIKKIYTDDSLRSPFSMVDLCKELESQTQKKILYSKC